MRDSFIGYFEPTSEMIAEGWKSALIALDTNVLLGLYRLPSEARTEVQNLLYRLKDRIWIPYHVLVEYHANRLDVLKEEYDAASKMEGDIRAAFSEFKSRISTDGNKKRQCWKSVSEQLNKMETAVVALRDTAKAERAHYIAPSDSDTVREFIEELLTGRVGPRPLDQKAVDAAEAEAEKRFSLGIGPGYKDDSKAGQRRVMDGLVYDRQYGDFMIWSQLLRHCEEQKVESVMFVTSDGKEDWWLDTKTSAGKRPQPELVMEMLRVAKVRNFEMYALKDFTPDAGKYLHVDVEQSTIDEVAKAEDSLFEATRIALFDFMKAASNQRSVRKLLGKQLKAEYDDFQKIISEVSEVVLYADGSGGVGVSVDVVGDVVVKLAMRLGAAIEESQTKLRQLLAYLVEYGPVPEVEVYLVSKGATSSAPATPAFRNYVRDSIQAIRPEVGTVRVWIGGPGESPEMGTFFNPL